jgi:hypothetical protein
MLSISHPRLSVYNLAWYPMAIAQASMVSRTLRVMRNQQKQKQHTLLWCELVG